MSRTVNKPKIIDCIEIISKEFSQFKDHRSFYEISLKDMLMSSYAVFALKYPSLLSFDKDMRFDVTKKSNMKSMFGIQNIPSDTQLRDVIDKVNTKSFRPLFKSLFFYAQRNKLLEGFQFKKIAGKPYYLLSTDGSGYFRSDKIGCLNCNDYKGSDRKKMKKDGHNILAGSIIHPDQKEVIPLCPEAIVSQDGNNKNDCEQNAFHRFIDDLKKEHPRLNCILLLDALYSNGPIINKLFKHEYSFIIGIKDTSKSAFRQLNDGEKDGSTQYYEETFEIGDKVKKQVIRRYRFRNNIHLSQDPTSVRVNILEFWEEINWKGKRGDETKKCHFSWVTDLDINQNTVVDLAKGGRARWKIENETFNTLKNQGYNLEHSYGHGKNFLSVNFIMMMFLSFFVDQIQQASCNYFKRARQRKSSKAGVWNSIRSAFDLLENLSWKEIYQHLSGEKRITLRLLNTS